MPRAKKKKEPEVAGPYVFADAEVVRPVDRWSLEWTPLRELLGMELADSFMFMCPLRLDDGAMLYAYKHRDTRRYLHLTPDRRAFRYIGSDEHPGRYVQIGRDRAIHEGFENWEQLAHASDDLEAQRDLLDEAVHYARMAMIFPYVLEDAAARDEEHRVAAEEERRAEALAERSPLRAVGNADAA